MGQDEVVYAGCLGQGPSFVTCQYLCKGPEAAKAEISCYYLSLPATFLYLTTFVRVR